MIVESLNHWIQEALAHIGEPKTEHEEGYRLALSHVKEFIAQEIELMDYEASNDK